MRSIYGIGCGSGELLELPLPGCAADFVPLFSQIGAIIMLPGNMAPADWEGGRSEYFLTGPGRFLQAKGALPRAEPIRGTLGRATNGSLIIASRKYVTTLEVPTCDATIEFVRGLQGNWRGFRFWLLTDGGRLIGGPLGIKPAYVNAGIAYPSGRGSFEQGYLELEWFAGTDEAAAYVPEMLPGGDSIPGDMPTTTCDMYSQYYNNHTGNVLLWTANGGAIPATPNTRLWVFQNGQKLDVTIGQYTVTANTSPGQSTITINVLTHFDGANYLIVSYPT